MDQTEEIVEGMLKENTGRHMLDSGGAYGRQWERNQTRNFAKEERCGISFRYGVEVCINLYHWMAEKLDYWPEMQALFDAHSEDSSHSYLHDMETFVEYLEANGRPGYKVEFTDNSYNSENLLSQTIQFSVITHPDEESFILLQVHGGCDVRGGYTKPKVFKFGMNCDDWWDFLNYRSARIYCTNTKCEARWFTDDAYHWYADEPGCYDTEEYNKLSEYPYVKHGDEHEGAVIEGPTKGIIYVDAHDTGHCPVCATGKLEADWY